jgi:hypothetical protein
MHTVVVGGGAMTTPYSCLQADANTCPAGCQADLDLLASACHAEDAVRWQGNGLPANPTLGAPNGTVVSPFDAFQLFLNGTASVPTNQQHGVTIGRGAGRGAQQGQQAQRQVGRAHVVGAQLHLAAVRRAREGGHAHAGAVDKQVQRKAQRCKCGNEGVHRAVHSAQQLLAHGQRRREEAG